MLAASGVSPDTPNLDGSGCLCRDCLTAPETSIFDENGALTRQYLLNRGTCCGNKCRNCPFDWENITDSVD
jgi:hypothetical protein